MLGKTIMTKSLKSPQRFELHFSVAKTDDDIIVLTGGNNSQLKVGFMTVKTTSSYNPRSDTWQNEPDMQIPRFSHSSLNIGKKIYVVGGQSMNGALYKSSIEILDMNRKRSKWFCGGRRWELIEMVFPCRGMPLVS